MDATEEVDERPPSRAKKPPSTTSRTRTSARSKAVLNDVPETGEEEHSVEDSPPAVKRRRGAVKEEPAAVSDDTMHQDPLPRKGRPAASSRTSVNTRRVRTSVAAKDEDDDEVEEVSAPARRSTRSSAPPKPEPSNFAVPSEKPKKQPVRGGRKPVVISDDDSDIVEVSAAEVALSTSKARASKSKKSGSRAGPSKVQVKQKSPSPAPIPESDPEHESEPEPTHDHPLGAQDDGPPLSAPKPSPKKVVPSPVVESDEEEPLIERPSSHVPMIQPHTPAPEEPEGPRPRLVIHKIALVNFKSYAGRQEIGPFHKVGGFYYAPSAGLTLVFSHSLRLSAPMDPESLTPSMHSCSFLGTELRRCAKGNYPNSFTIRTGIPTSNNAAWRYIFGRSWI